MISAVGTSLVSVAAFGATTAANYALSGLIDPRMAGLFIAGGLAGGVAGVTLGGLSPEARAPFVRCSASRSFLSAFMSPRGVVRRRGLIREFIFESRQLPIPAVCDTPVSCYNETFTDMELKL